MTSCQSSNPTSFMWGLQNPPPVHTLDGCLWSSRPVPDLPAKSIFYFSNEDFLEGRRKGLQAFLDKSVWAFLLLVFQPSHARNGCLSPPQSRAHDSVPVRQPAPPLPADAAPRGSHPGLRAGPHPLHRDGRHPHLRLVQSGFSSGSGGRTHQGVQLGRVVRVHGEVPQAQNSELFNVAL